MDNECRAFCRLVNEEGVNSMGLSSDWLDALSPTRGESLTSTTLKLLVCSTAVLTVKSFSS